MHPYSNHNSYNGHSSHGTVTASHDSYYSQSEWAARHPGNNQMKTGDRLVSPHQALDLCKEPGLLTVDLSKPEVYRHMHLPSAVHLHPGELLSGEPPATGRLPSELQLSQMLSQIGFCGQKVLIYDDEGGGWAGRFAWTLHLLGHDDWQVIDGGLLAWHWLGLDLSADVPAPGPSSFKARLVSSRLAESRAELAEVRKALDDDTLIWDARSPEEYRGERQTALRAGHIPGAVNLEWTALMDAGRRLQLRRDAGDLLQKAGFSQSRPLITYCQSHHRSAFAWLIGFNLGYTIKGYDGAWSEWGNLPDTPVEK